MMPPALKEDFVQPPRTPSKLSESVWRARRDSNLRRFAGVSEAGARSRNPEPSEGSEKHLARPERFELEAVCGGERSGSPQPKSRA